MVIMVMSVSGCSNEDPMMIKETSDENAYERSENHLEDFDGYVEVDLSYDRMRGGNLSLAEDTELSEEDFVRWKQWGVNTLRVNFNKDDLSNPYSDQPTDEDLWIPYKSNRVKMAEWIRLAGIYDIEVNITLDHIWGDDHDSEQMWRDGEESIYLSHRINLSVAMSEWLQQYDHVGYFCPWNETYPYNDLYHEWFVDAVVEEIRAINKDVTIVLMVPGAWGDIENFSAWDGVEDENTIYAVNLYDPYTYTHQGLYDIPLTDEGWPGNHQSGAKPEETSYADIEAARDFLAVIVDFKERTGKEVVVTEIGVVRWAKDKDRYISDVLSLLEEMEVGWLFHSIAGWNGWNPSYNGDEEVSIEPYSGHETDLLKVLKGYWALNIIQ